MKKPVLGLLIGGVLGALDGLTAWFTPAVRDQIIGIVIGSTIKGILTGAIIGWFAKRTQSLPTAILFGLAVGVALAFCISIAQKLATGTGHYWEIMLPGGILGLIVGYATFTFRPKTASGASV